MAGRSQSGGIAVRVRIVVPDRLEEDPEPSAKKGKGFFQGGGDKMKASVEEGEPLTLAVWLYYSGLM